MTEIFNRKEEKIKRRVLRNNMSEAEKLLWMRLRRRQIKNKRFLRQYSVGKYVIDFYCPELKLAIEVDGSTHTTEDEIQYDKSRQDEIENLGIKFLRFTNEDVFERSDKVILDIELFIDQIHMKEILNQP